MKIRRKTIILKKIKKIFFTPTILYIFFKKVHFFAQIINPKPDHVKPEPDFQNQQKPDPSPNPNVQNPKPPDPDYLKPNP